MAIEFTDYNRITDVLMWFTDTITLNFTVGLSTKSKINGERRFFQYETEYKDGSYSNDSLRSIKRNMNFFFTIDNKESFAAGMILRPQDVQTLIMLIDSKIMPWYFGTEEYAFQIVDNKLTLKEFEPVYFTQSESKWIKFEPIVYSYEDGSFTQGLQMILAQDVYIPMTLDKLLGFIHLLKNTDMYAVACAMVNYVKIQPYGVNEYKVGGLGTGRPREDWAPPREVKNRTGNNFLDSAKNKE